MFQYSNKYYSQAVESLKIQHFYHIHPHLITPYYLFYRTPTKNYISTTILAAINLSQPLQNPLFSYVFKQLQTNLPNITEQSSYNQASFSINPLGINCTKKRLQLFSHNLSQIIHHIISLSQTIDNLH